MLIVVSLPDTPIAILQYKSMVASLTLFRPSFLTAALVKGSHFLALQMVKFSSLHNEGRPVEVLYH